LRSKSGVLNNFVHEDRFRYAPADASAEA
jgi:hypothetical protein